MSFSAAAFALLVIPGPAVMYIVTRSAAQGRAAGLVSVAGIHIGTLVHIVAAMVGLSAVLAASATAFTAVKLLGAAYLVYLGVQTLRNHHRVGSEDPTSLGAPRSLRRVFTDGVVLNVLNPKTAIFFLAFVPQFVDPNAARPALSVAVLGTVFIVLGVVSDGAYALAGGWMGGRLRSSVRLRRRSNLLAGGTYLGLGALTALSGNRAA